MVDVLEDFSFFVELSWVDVSDLGRLRFLRPSTIGKCIVCDLSRFYVVCTIIERKRTAGCIMVDHTK